MVLIGLIVFAVLFFISFFVNLQLWSIAKELKQEIVQNGITTIYTDYSVDDSAE